MSGITYRLSITEIFLERDAADGTRDLVREASWELVGTHESGVMAMRYGTQPLGDHAKHAVTKDMTPEMVAGWVEETFAADIMPALKADISTRILADVNSGHYRVMAPWKVRTPAAGQVDVEPRDTALLEHPG